MNKTVKNGPLCEKWVTFDQWVILYKIGHIWKNVSNRKKSVTFRKMGHPVKMVHI